MEILGKEEKLAIVLYEILSDGLSGKQESVYKALKKEYPITEMERRALLEYANDMGYIVLTGGNDLDKGRFLEIGTSDIIRKNKTLTKRGASELSRIILRNEKRISLINRADLFFKDRPYLFSYVMKAIYVILIFLLTLIIGLVS